MLYKEFPMNFIFFRKRFLSFCLLTALSLLIFGQAQAQMFSVEEDESVRNRAIPLNNISIGLEPTQFDYKGPVAGGPNSGLFGFDGSLIRLKYETFGFEAFLGVGGRLTGIDDIAYFDAGVKAGRGIRIIAQRNIRFQIPLQLKSSLTTVTNDQVIGAGSQFRQGTLTVGGGGELSVRFSDNIRFSAGAIPSYGFSFATGGTFGGQIFELETTSRIYYDSLFGDVGISVGWDYGFKRFDIEENVYDYNFRSHSFLIGITF